MKRGDDNRLIWSPSDLVTYLESPFASWMQRLFLEGVEGIRPDELSADVMLIQREGNLHEARHLAKLRAEGLDVAEIEPFGRDAVAETEAAIRERREVVFQARLSKGDFSGMADFVVLGDPGDSGVRRYEVRDTKLAASAKPYHLIQLCCYADMLETITGYLPERVAVILGNGALKPFRTEDFFHYYLRVKRGFEVLMAGFEPGKEPPTPAPRADHGRWQSHADKWLDDRDHLVRVAGITAGQIRKLEGAGIATLAALAATTRTSVPKLGDETFAALRLQAGAQAKTRERAQGSEGKAAVPWYEVIPPPPGDPARGLGMLPPASPMDVYFDIEGYPLVEGGLEYLLGASYYEGGEERFGDWWAHDSLQEKTSFEAFVDWVYARWRSDPSMHVYHYAPYEVTAMRKLMGRHATREDQVDTLLRRGVFVDLYRVVRQGILFGDDSYSIKRVEKLYFEGRKAAVKDAASSIVFYAEWMGSGEPEDWRESPLLRKIRDYNEEDCVSTWKLTAWLRERQEECGIAYVDPQVPKAGEEPGDAEAPPVNEGEARRQALADRMLAEVAAAWEHGDVAPEWRIHEMLAHLLNFHRREEKPVWWALFDRLERTPAELVEDMNCLGGIVRTDTPAYPVKRSTALEYRFDPNQDTKIGAGSEVIIRENRAVKATVESFDAEGLLVLKLGPSAIKLLDDEPLPGVISLLPSEYVSAEGLKESIERLVIQWCENRTLPPALRQLLTREGPDSGRALRRSGESLVEACLRILDGMDGAALIIQGPPGTGKTHTGSRMIAAGRFYSL